MNSKVSVIVPIYNSEKYLYDCVNSIINQTYNNLEIILVNDGSNDSSLQICNKLSELDSRIIVINKNNGGAASARNEGLNISTGKYIGFVDSDDYIEENMYEELVKSIEKNKSHASKSLFKPIKKLNDNLLLNKSEKWFILSIEEVSVCNTLYKSELLKEIRFKENVSYEDTIFTIEVLKKIDSISLVNKNMYRYYTHPNTTTSSPLRNKDLIKINIYEDLKNYILNTYGNNETILNYIEKGRKISLFDIIIKIANYGFDSTLSLDDIEHVVSDLYNLFKYKRKEVLFYKGISIKKKIQILMFSLHPRIYFKYKKIYNKSRKDI